MQNIKRIISFLLLFTPLTIYAQGVPKAYEAITYQAKLNGQTVTFILADGYIGASVIKLYLPDHKQPVIFEAGAGVEDESNQLKFVPDEQTRPDYFILENMQPVYEKTPSFITGKYYSNAKIVSVKFELIKQLKH